MKKKYLKIVGFTLLVAGVAISINLGVCANYKLERVNERKCRGFDLFRD